jgi:glycosyltransferase involved in cell wall biosynthesis
MNNSPLVSIIIPAYNYSHFLFETLGDIQKQTYQNWECIIVDDGSSDNTKEVVAQIVKKDQRFIYIYQNNKGPNAARNNGINHSKGEFIQFLDADDKMEHHKLEVQVKFFSGEILAGK